MGRKLWKLVKSCMLFVGTISAIFTILFVVIAKLTPKPVAWLLHKVFDKPAAKPSKDMQAENVQEIENIHYGESTQEVLDLYVPVEKGEYPVILWIHGGAFVGGDKKDVIYFARALAKRGYAVAAINYGLAPEAQYPTPILQTNKAYEFLLQGTYLEKEKLDMSQVFLAGDSAGAFIAVQCALLQTNEEYRQAFLKRECITDIPKINYKGMLLYCGPYLLAETNRIDSPFVSFFIKQVQWAYFGDKNFAKNEHLSEIDVIQYITKEYPPTFITDGNTFSFAEHGKALAEKLKDEGVEVAELFFDNKEKIMHEYQFDLSNKAGKEAFETTLSFLEKHSDTSQCVPAEGFYTLEKQFPSI